MKKVLLILALLIGMYSINGLVEAKTVINNNLSSAIKLYKAKNYSQSYIVLSDYIKKDPSNALACYYYAMTCAQIGKADLAVEYYQKVINLSPGTKLSKYAEKGKVCIETPDKCSDFDKKSDFDSFIQGKFGSGFSEEARGEKEKKKIENMMREMNRKDDISPDKFNEFKDFSGQAPSNDEIVNAIKVLQKAGLVDLLSSNVNYSNLSVLNGNSRELDVMQMLYGNSNNQNLSPQVIQSLLTNQFSVGF